MRGLLVLPLALAAACSFDHSGVAADDTTGDGSVIDADPGAPDAVPVDTGPADSDGDTIPDATDNCPAVSNTDQADEDGDGRGDKCDDCPHVVDPAQVSADGDLVGDVCDPHPGSAGDAIVFFDGFNGASVSSAWQVGLGDDSWTESGGLLHQTSTTREEKALVLKNQDFTEVTVDTAFTPTNIPPAAFNDDTRAAGAVTAFTNSGGGTGRTAAVEDHLASLNPAYAIAMVIGGSEVANYNYMHNGFSTSRYVLRASADVDTQSATVTEADATVTTGTEVNSVSQPGEVGVRTLDAAVDFEYVVVFTYTPPN